MEIYFSLLHPLRGVLKLFIKEIGLNREQKYVQRDIEREEETEKKRHVGWATETAQDMTWRERQREQIKNES